MNIIFEHFDVNDNFQDITKNIKQTNIETYINSERKSPDTNQVHQCPFSCRSVSFFEVT